MKSAIVEVVNRIGETGVFRALFSQCLPVFMLHRIETNRASIPGAIHEDTLRKYLEYLAARDYKVLTMHQLWEFLAGHNPIPSKSVMFTVDDGFYDHHDAAAKVFGEFGYALNFFVITEFLDQSLWPWDDQVSYAMEETTKQDVTLVLPSGIHYELNIDEHLRRECIRSLRDVLKSCNQSNLYDWMRAEFYPKLEVKFPDTVPNRYRSMSWDDARSLSQHGHGVFPHTCSHRILSSLSAEERRREIADSVSTVEREVGAVPRAFAYPTGRVSDYGSQDVSALKSLGIELAFSTMTGYVRSGSNTDHYSLPRFSLPEKMADFLQIVNRFEAVKDRLL